MLAGINKVETDFGKNTSTSSAGAQGWMQFLPSTWATYGVDGDGDGRKDIADPWDAIFGAAKYLRASGAPDDWHGAILAYNHAEWYVQEVVSYAERFASGSAISTAGIGCAMAAAGPADLQTAIKLFQPRRYVMLPRRFMAPGYSPEPVDARIHLDAEWRTYGGRLSPPSSRTSQCSAIPSRQ